MNDQQLRNRELIIENEELREVLNEAASCVIFCEHNNGDKRHANLSERINDLLQLR